MKKIILLLLLTFVETSFCMQKEESGQDACTVLKVPVSIRPEKKFDENRYFGVAKIPSSIPFSFSNQTIFISSIALVLNNHIECNLNIESISELGIKVRKDTILKCDLDNMPTFLFKDKRDKKKIYALFAKTKQKHYQKGFCTYTTVTPVVGFCLIDKVILLHK